MPNHRQKQIVHDFRLKTLVWGVFLISPRTRMKCIGKIACALHRTAGSGAQSRSHALVFQIIPHGQQGLANLFMR